MEAKTLTIIRHPAPMFVPADANLVKLSLTDVARNILRWGTVAVDFELGGLACVAKDLVNRLVVADVETIVLAQRIDGVDDGRGFGAAELSGVLGADDGEKCCYQSG